MDYDEITKHLGQFGRYQKVIYFLLCLVNVPVAFNNMGIVFIAGVPKHWCKTPQLLALNITDDVIRNVTIPLAGKEGESYKSCERYAYERNYSKWDLHDVASAMAGGKSNMHVEMCSSGWTYDDSIYTSTIVSQWDLVCDRKWLQVLATSVYMAGLMVGTVIIGSAADILGRRPAFIVSLIGTILASIVVSFSPNYATFVVLRFVSAFFNMALLTTAFVMGVELVGPDYRLHAGIIMYYFWAGGYMLFAFLAYYIRDWMKLNLVASASMALLLVLVFFVPESPRWLYLQGRNEEAEKIVRRAAKFNNVRLSSKLDVIVQPTKTGYLWDLVRTPRMACRSLNIFFNWFVNSCVYYGLSLNTSNLGGNGFVNFAIAAGVEIPAYMLCQVALHFVGRRLPLCMCMVGGGIALLCTMAVPTGLNWVTIVLAMVGKFCISASFIMMYVFTAEMYPTSVRNVGVGAGSAWARVGGIVAPFIGQLGDTNKLIPLVVFGVLSITAGLLGLLFPETKDKALPETLEDGENFGRKVITVCEKPPAEEGNSII